MATRQVVLDDISGEEGASTVRFGFGDRQWDIDLTEANTAALEKALGRFIEKGREVVKKASGGDGELALIREWAAAQNPPIEVASKGRIAVDVVDRYRAAHANGSSAPAAS